MIQSNSTSDKHILIIDSFALLFRGYFSMAMSGNFMRNSKGLYTNGLYQFTRYMLDAIKKFKPTHVVCAFDMGKSTFRNELYPQYKAQRDEPPLELIPQFSKLWELVDAFDIPCVGREGYEADDMIGSMAKHFSEKGIQVSILTGDGDALQLINGCTRVVMMDKGFGNYKIIDSNNLEEVKGVKYPHQIIEMKGLMGDTSDNIPGCPSVGPKTALKLVEQYETIDGVFANIDQIKGKLKDKLLEFKDQIYLSRDLATIRTDLTFDCVLEHCVYEWKRDKLLSVLEDLEFRTIIRTIA